MIIVKTNTGDTFLNEKHCFYVEHIKEEKKVEGKRIGADFDISGVESVRYVSDAEAIDYTDKGSEVEKLQKQVELITELSAIKSTIISEIRYLYSIAYGFVKKIAETKEPPTDSWSSFVAEAEKFVNNAADISDLKIGPFFTRLDSLYKELKDVTKDGSV